MCSVLLNAETSWAGPILSTEEKLYSQGNEELIIRDFFNDRREGFFLDVGCNDYKRHSTTYYLEKHLGWKGIGIDAIPTFKEGYDRERPHTKFFHYIVTDHEGTRDPFYVSLASLDVSSTSPSAVLEHGPSYVKVEIPTITLNTLLEREGVETIDFLSMDIEDGEPKALAGFDLQKYRPKLVCIEAHATVRIEIADYFKKHEYERLPEYDAYDTVNWYFKPREGS